MYGEPMQPICRSGAVGVLAGAGYIFNINGELVCEVVHPYPQGLGLYKKQTKKMLQWFGKIGLAIFLGVDEIIIVSINICS
jgi:hypothetical protein